ncbi:hypothetical protein [Cohnella silvisoli]|uniref:Uncharacterized protein n=1 Tax=Cohnella silvisoli TaxID=2873699 RepID=A0ABV1KW64_9BACL|nr:hypothetical protein [Cohnella silvisoli]MCD9023743.1 hypothetical protein [Cohnella silvisoli]
MRKWTGIRVWKLIVTGTFVAIMAIVGSMAAMDNRAAAAGDAYVNYDSVNRIWTIGTAAVEKKLQLNASGQYLQTSFKNKLTGQEYIQGAALSDEFSVKIEGTTYTGSSTGWVYDAHTLSTLSQGELQLVVTFHNSDIKVNRYYIVYPSTGIVQEWSVIQNVSGSAKLFSNPSLFRQKAMANDVANTDFMYMTGGANFTGSHLLKTVALTSGYARTFNSQDPPEVITVDGKYENGVMDNIQGTAIYNEFFVLRNRSTNSGMYLLFDYTGHWAADLGNYGGNFAMNGKVFMSDYSVPNNASITTPKSLTGVFAGDVDDMGNSILNYVYTYKWDYTRDAYFAKVKTGQWNVNVPQTENAFQAINNGRYIGIDTGWIDDNWYDRKGDWNNMFHDDFKGLIAYAALSGMSYNIWNPPWQADAQSDVLTQNPSYQVGNDTPTYYGSHLNLANDNAVSWIRNDLNGKQSQWGTHALRYDAQPSWPSNGSDNDMLAQSNNFYQLLKTFKDDNPSAGIFGVSSGGELLTIESARYSDTQQNTDGNVMHYDGYYSSLITPLDKLFTGGNTENYQWQNPYSKNNRGTLSMATLVQMNVADAVVSDADKESWRKDIELYHYFKTEGVVGRWVKVYRPNVSTGDKTYFLQKMSGDSTKGYLTTRHNESMIGNNVTVYPKGLTPSANYTVATLEGGRATATNTGSYWMTNGITLTPLKRGEVIFFNLENRPGNGSDTTAPIAPSNVTKSQTAYLKHGGTQVVWTAGTDNNWISYYEIYKNGTPYTKVSTGTFFFDVNGSVDDSYQVRTVDGDGNTSSLVAAYSTDTSIASTTYKLSTDFSNKQSGKGWSYVQWNGSSFSNLTWDGAGTWQGAYPFNLVFHPTQLHPDTNDTAVAWTAPQAGYIKVSGNVAKAFAGGDGVNVKIMKNGTQIWPASGWQSISSVDTIGWNHDLAVKVTTGDKIYFVVNKNGNNAFDETSWDPVINYVSSGWNASSGFGTTQGLNNWYYLESSGITYPQLTWNAAANAWKGSNAYNLIWSPAHIHPDLTDTVRAWKAPNAGTVILSGNVRKGNSGGDGIQVKMMKNGSQVWPASGWQSISGTDITGINHNLKINVAANDMIYFVVNQNVNKDFDETIWDPVIVYDATASVATPLPSYAATADFSFTQGNWNWFYLQASGSTYSNMTWNSVDHRWNGAYTYNIISMPDQMHPDVNDTVRGWAAPKTGTVRLTGTVKKSASGIGGDGINVKIMKNGTQIWPAGGWQLIGGADTTGIAYDFSMSVNQGDNLYFVVNRNGNNGFDATAWNPKIEYTSIP